MDTHTTGLGHQPPALAEVLEGLNDLLQLDHDAIGAYDIAIEKLQDRDHADQVLGFRRDHERHIRELNDLIAGLGGTPMNHPHATGPFKAAMQSLGGLAGDKGILLAWRTNELQVRTKYDSYASKAMLWPPEVKRIVDGAALDEERHYRWVADVLQRMGIGAGENPDLDGPDRARERANAGLGLVNQAKERVAGVAEQVGERVSELAGTVRERATAGAGAVGNRISGLLDTESGPLAGPLSGARTRVDDASVRLRGHAETARVRAGDAQVAFEERARERPLQTLLMAGLAGFVIGRLLR